jgi:hypothetical protein
MFGDFGFILRLDDYATEARFVGVAANAANEAKVRLVGVPGVSIDGPKASTKIGVVELKATTGLIGRERIAIATDIVWVSRALWLTNSTDGTLVDSVRRLTAWLVEGHCWGNAWLYSE